MIMIYWPRGNFGPILFNRLGYLLRHVRTGTTFGPAGSIVATDISEGILEFAARNAAAAGYANICVHRAGAEDLQLEQSTFDAAVCRLGLMFLPNPHAGISEVLRVLKPGGSFCSMVFAGPETNPCVRILIAASAALWLRFLLKNDPDLSSEVWMRDTVVHLGPAGPLMSIGLMILPIVFSPISSGPITVAAGALYGTFWGSLLMRAQSWLRARLHAEARAETPRPIPNSRFPRIADIQTEAGPNLWKKRPKISPLDVHFLLGDK